MGAVGTPSGPPQVSCPPLFQGALEHDEAEDLAAAFAPLAEPSRLRLISLIGALPGGEPCVQDLVTAVGLTQPTVSHHVKVLHDAGLLDRERRGARIHYRLNQAGIHALRTALALDPS